MVKVNQTLELMRSHRSVRYYSSEPVTESMVHSILTSAQCASTSSFVQAYSIIQVTDGNIRKEIADIAGGQVWVEKAPVFFVFCADLTRLLQSCSSHDLTSESGYTEQSLVATIDTALFGQNVILAAESEGLGGVFIGGIRNDPHTICNLLDIPEHVYPVFGMCLGYPEQSEDTKPRLPLGAILKMGKYHPTDLQTLEEYDEITRKYWSSRKNNMKKESWSEQMAEFSSQKTREHMKDFLVEKGFFQK